MLAGPKGQQRQIDTTNQEGDGQFGVHGCHRGGGHAQWPNCPAEKLRCKLVLFFFVQIIFIEKIN